MHIRLKYSLVHFRITRCPHYYALVSLSLSLLLFLTLLFVLLPLLLLLKLLRLLLFFLFWLFLAQLY